MKYPTTICPACQGEEIEFPLYETLPCSDIQCHDIISHYLPIPIEHVELTCNCGAQLIIDQILDKNIYDYSWVWGGEDNVWFLKYKTNEKENEE